MSNYPENLLVGRVSFSRMALLLLACCVETQSARAQSTVTAYPSPRGIEPSPDYQVCVRDRDIFVYKTPAFSMATFAVAGEADIVVTVRRPIQRPVVRPLSRGTKTTIDGDRLRIHIQGPCQLALEVDDDLRRPLFVFANPPEENAPTALSPGVRYFEGGRIHEAGRIELKDREILYLAGGAVVHGSVLAKGISGARILGPGILDGSTRTTQMKMIQLDNCRDVELNGPIVLGSYGWAIVPRLSEDIRLRNVKVLSWRENDDGCDPDSSRRVSVDNCFFRTKDDCIAVKTHTDSRATSATAPADPNAYDTDDVRVSNSIFWSSEWGHALTVGFAVRAPLIRNVVFAHCDIIKKEKGPALSIDNHDLGSIENVRFEDIRVEDGCDKLLAVKVAFSEYSADCPFEFFRNNPARQAPTGEAWLKVQQEKRLLQRGTVRNVLFKDIQILGARLPDSEVRGFSTRNEISDVVFHNVQHQGRRLNSPQEANLRIQYATGVRFEP